MGLTPKIAKFVKSFGPMLDLANRRGGWWVWDLDDQSCEYMSPALWETFGVDPETKEHTPSAWLDLIHPDDGAAAMTAFERHIGTGGLSPYELVVRYRHTAGHWVHVRCSGQADLDLGVMVGCHADVTEHVEASARIAEYATKFAAQSDRLEKLGL